MKVTIDVKHQLDMDHKLRMHFSKQHLILFKKYIKPEQPCCMYVIL